MPYPLAVDRAPADPGTGVSREKLSIVEAEAPAGPLPVSDLPQPLRDFVDGGLTVKLSLRDVLELQRVDSIDRQRNRLLSQLVFASRELAEAHLYGVAEMAEQRGRVRAGSAAWCGECQMTSVDGEFKHADLCKTGRVISILWQLVKLSAPEETFNSKGKEAAPDGERPEAGDGIRPRGHSFDSPYDWAGELACAFCGARGGKDWSLVSQSSHALRTDLQRNQCEVRKAGWSYRYEHKCAAAEGGAQ